MRLLIDARGGISGDMFAAALVAAGADRSLMSKAMTDAAAKLGRGEVSFSRLEDGTTQAAISLETDRRHLEESEARRYLRELFTDYGIADPYRTFGQTVLENLLAGEKRAHSELGIHVEDPEFEPHGHHHGDATFLHEAQDIIIDITGAVIGLADLKLPPSAGLLHPVSVGGGTVTFSHGTLPVPAPATKILLDEHGIPWSMGPIEKELCTPTGAAILSALDVGSASLSNADVGRYPVSGRSRGSKIFDIPPLHIHGG